MDRGNSGLVGRLVAKWTRDRDEPLTARLAKASTYARDLARARLYLRQADDTAADVRVIGRPIIRNEGRLVIGDRTWFRSIVAPIEITVAPGAEIQIGSDTHINSGTSICAYRSVRIGCRVEVAPYVSIYDTNFHDLYDRNASPEPEPVTVEDDVWLCAKSSVLPGITVGRGAVVAAHALVIRDVEPFSVVSGVPAKVIRRLDPDRFVVRPPV